MRSGLPSESGIVFAKYLTFSTAASVSASRGFASLIPVGVDPVGCSAPVGSDPVGRSAPVAGVGVIVEDIRKLLFRPGQSNSAARERIPLSPVTPSAARGRDQSTFLAFPVAAARRLSIRSQAPGTPSGCATNETRCGSTSQASIPTDGLASQAARNRLISLSRSG